jgi:hypothetical protein
MSSEVSRGAIYTSPTGSILVKLGAIKEDAVTSSDTDKQRFLTMAEAAVVVGMSRFTLRQRILAGELVAYDDARDRRRRLIAARDLQTLSTPRPRTRIMG